MSHPGHRRVLFSALLLIVAGTSRSYADARLLPHETAAIDAIVRKEMQRQKLIGVAVGIIHDGEVVYTKGFGLADRKRNRPVTTDTVFNWASCSKPVIAVAAMQLVQQGKLDLDAPISNYLPNLPNWMQRITTRHLLCHQSGMPHYGNLIMPSGKRFNRGQEEDPENAIHRFLNSPPVGVPGGQLKYSSHAYVLLSAVVQRAGGQPISLQLASRITGPLRLSSFTLDRHREQTNWTKGYINGGRVAVPAPAEAHFWKHGAGGYKSNINDFAQFAAALCNRELIDEATSNIMWTRQKTFGSTSPTSYGLGMKVNDSDDTLRVWHNGRQNEARTRMFLYPDAKSGIVVMSNTRSCDPDDITSALSAYYTP